MASPAQESASTRTPSYPLVPQDVWWRLRKLFISKGQPRPAWNEDYLLSIGLRQSKASARNVVRPFKRFGLFTDDGKPAGRFWDWLDDSKYSKVCNQILHEVYPEALTAIFTSTDDDERARLVSWFQRNQNVMPDVAKQYAAFYMLLLKADVSEQDDAAPQKSPKTPKTIGTQPNSSRVRANGAKTRTSSSSAYETGASNMASAVDGHESDHPHATPRRPSRGFEPSLNINVQIHIPAEATPEQVDQIFKSMAKHLYRRQDEADE